ncbi:MAG: hypothetical protein ABFD49_09445 [Armatimonadota bacterium]|nr:hypothetical protein [bacterium]
MKTSVIIAITILIAASACFAAPTSTEGGLIPPPAINIPYGGTVVTEINISDNDVLGIIKQALPVIANVMQSQPAQTQDGQPTAVFAAKSLDLQAFGQAIGGITGIRFIIAKYEKQISPSDMVKQFGDGVAKIGKFSKIASDFAFVPGVAGIYAQENNSGYMGFMYDYNGKVLYALRIVGSVDIPKLIDLATKCGSFPKQVIECPQEQPGEETAPSMSE